MSLRCGIIGLPNVGKSTLFNALTRAGAEVASFPFTTVSPNVGIAPVRDPRLEQLAGLIKPQKMTPTTIEFVDVAGLVKGAHRGEGLGNEFLSRIRGVDVLVEVVRCFRGEGIAHPEGDINPVRDVETIDLELLLSDLEVLERRLTKLNKLVKSKVSQNKEKLALLEKVKEILEKGEFLRKICSKEERTRLAEEGFLTLKSFIYVANIDEADLNSPSSFLKSLREYTSREGVELIEICAQLEAELAELPEEESREFLKELRIKERGLDRLIKEAYRLLGLISFFTITGGKEVRAWSVERGTPAPQAAGKVHSDMEKGFIRAEVISIASLLKLGSIKQAKEKGKTRIEGKEYLVEDGDVIHFIFTPLERKLRP